MNALSRRRFLKISAATFGAGAAATQIPPLTHLAHAATAPGEVTTVPTFCEMCFWRCAGFASVRDGKVWKFEGNPIDPQSRGRLCPRGSGAPGAINDPDRLRTPLIRTGERGKEAWKTATWDEALTHVADRMQKIKGEHGPESIAMLYHGIGVRFIQHVLKSYGCINMAGASFAQCRGPRDVGFNLTFGQGLGSPEPTDIENTDCLVLIGSHLGENMHNTQVQEFATAIRGGADVIVVDPRYSVAASKARYWLPIRPGTDTALLLAWMNVLIGEGKYDRAYLEQYAYGFEQLQAHVAPFTPEWAYPRTGIEPHVIRETARLMAGARPAALVHPGRHVTWYGNDTQRSRAIAILNALLGSWGRRGGFYVPAQAEVPGYTCALYPEGKALPADRPEPGAYPLGDQVLAQGVCNATIGSGLDDSRIKGWLVYGSNLPTTLPAPEETQRAIQALELLVTVDVLPMEIVGWSDIVLPEATYLERWDDLNTPAFRTPYVAVRQPAVEPLFDTKPGWWIAKEIGTRLGLADYFPWADGESYVRARVDAAGLDWDALRRDGVIELPAAPLYFEEGAVPEFYTDSGRIELYSQKLAAHGFDPLPVFDDAEVEDPPAGYYRLLTGRAPSHTFGRTTNNRLLSQVHDANPVWVNRDVARQWGLRDGERVYLQNQDGVRSSFTTTVKVTARIRPDAVYLVHGYGHKAKELRFAHGRGIDDTELITRYRTDPIMGGTGMNVNFVTFVRAAEVVA